MNIYDGFGFRVFNWCQVSVDVEELFLCQHKIPLRSELLPEFEETSSINRCMGITAQSTFQETIIENKSEKIAESEIENIGRYYYFEKNIFTLIKLM